MATPNKKKINWLLKLAANADQAIKDLTRSGDNLSKTIRDSAKEATKIYDPATIQAVQKSVEEAQEAIQNNEKALGDIEEELQGLRIFPNARNQLTHILSTARRAHKLAQKARFNMIGSPEEYEQIDAT